ncbi:MAG: hypothetical protein NTW13_04870 [Candidatus Omnitrophica bacterium]|nr:hypothetical protein [Candidatus Omnitrophota bacterium]
MKSLVIYYSRYGNTARVADVLLEALRQKGEASAIEIEYLNHKQNLFRRAFFRLLPTLVRLAPINSDLKQYDLICFGIPVWGGRPSAPITKYLSLIKHIGKKKVICYYVYGSEISAQQCAKYIERVLYRKGCSLVINAFIPWENIDDQWFLSNAINQAIALAT